MDIDSFEVLVNKRSDLEDFEPSHKCSYCNNYQSQVLSVPIVYGWRVKCEPVNICKTCLTKMIKQLDQNMLGGIKNWRWDEDTRKETEVELGQHVLYETGDKDCPGVIMDSNDVVFLGLCRVCGGAEATLSTACPGRELTEVEEQMISDGSLDFVVGEDRLLMVNPNLITLVQNFLK